nr:histidine kinase [uncultured Dyadobacter sp.]
MRQFADKYLKLTPTELVFFGAVFILFPILTEYEYSLYEQINVLPSANAVLERTLLSTLRTLPYLIYYKAILPFTFKKRYLAFGWRLILFFLFLDAYMHYAVHGLVMHMKFLPEFITANARRWFDASTPVHFSIVYVIRELLMVTALGYYRYSSNQNKELSELREYQLRAELDLLKLQIQPHFFFNTLNNIYALALQNSPKTAPLVAQHAEIMRFVLHQSNSSIVRLSEEVAFLTNYVAVEKIRFPEQIRIQIETQGRLSAVAIEPLLLLPYIENIFKHGLRNESNGGYADIAIVLMGQELILSAKNSKASMKRLPANHECTGITNSRKRLALLYPEKHQLKIDEDQASYAVELRIILRNYDPMPSGGR